MVKRLFLALAALAACGFAQAPGILRVVAIVPVLGWFVSIVVIGIWVLVANVIAVRQALDYETTPPAIAVCALAWVVQAILVAVFGGVRLFACHRVDEVATEERGEFEGLPDGKYQVGGMPPGDYLIGALSDLEPGMQYDPEFLKSMIVASTRVTIGEGAKVRGVFVSVDPERDTPAILKDYLGSFDKRIIGLTGERAALEIIGA